MAEYIDKEAVGQTVLELPSKIDDDGYIWVLRRDAFRAVDDCPAADVRENVPVTLRLETEGIDGHPTWYRKRFYCPRCDLLIRTESWDEKYCFGSGTCLRQNIDPKYCPNCGAKMDGEDGDA